MKVGQPGYEQEYSRSVWFSKVRHPAESTQPQASIAAPQSAGDAFLGLNVRKPRQSRCTGKVSPAE